MSLIICEVCGKVKQVHGTSGGTETMCEAMTVKEWCSCPRPRAADWPYDWRDAELARLRAELEQAKADVERWAGSSGFYSDSLAMANESAQVLQAERDKYAAALVEIRGICVSMMDGWGQTVEVLDKIRKITLTAIKRQPTEPAHRPETFT